MAEEFVATHQAKQDPPPRVRITIYNPKLGHITVAPADTAEREHDGRDGTMMQGQEKQPVAVFEGDAIIEYEGTHICAVMRPSDVSAWFEPIPGSKLPALPKKTASSARVSDAIKESEA